MKYIKQVVYTAFLVLSTLPVYAGLITHTDYVDGQTITAAAQNTNENVVFNEFNGSIENVNVRSNAAIAVTKLQTGTAGQVLLSSTTANAWGWTGLVIQSSQCTTTSSTTATSASYSIAQTCAITPKSTASKVRVTITGTHKHDNGSATFYFSIFRNGVDTESSGSGYLQHQVNIATASNYKIPLSITYLDSPSSTSAVTYTIRFKNSDNTTSSSYNYDAGTAIMLLEEVGQ
jgi:hypothetical protein